MVEDWVPRIEGSVLGKFWMSMAWMSFESKKLNWKILETDGLIRLVQGRTSIGKSCLLVAVRVVFWLGLKTLHLMSWKMKMELTLSICL